MLVFGHYWSICPYAVYLQAFAVSKMETCACLVRFPSWLDPGNSPYILYSKLQAVCSIKEKNYHLFSEISWLVEFNGHSRTLWFIKPSHFSVNMLCSSV